MADEAVNPAPGAAPERRWGSSGYAGEWVRATDIGVGERARWIDDDGESATPAAPLPRPPKPEIGTDQPGA